MEAKYKESHDSVSVKFVHNKQKLNYSLSRSGSRVSGDISIGAELCRKIFQSIEEVVHNKKSRAGKNFGESLRCIATVANSCISYEHFLIKLQDLIPKNSNKKAA